MNPPSVTADVTASSAPPRRPRAALLTVPVLFLVIVAAPVAVVIASALAVYDRENRKRWISLAVIAGLVIVVLYLPWMLFIEPRQDSVNAT